MDTIQTSYAELKTITERVPAHLRAKILQPEDRRKPGEWSEREILGHLIDSASNNHLRFVNAIVTGEVHLPSYEQEQWVMLQHYDTEPWERLVSLWENYNLHLLHLLKHLPEDRLATLCYIGQNAPMTLQELILDYLHHLKHHLADLAPDYQIAS
jgi:hypothetical protein